MSQAALDDLNKALQESREAQRVCAWCGFKAQIDHHELAEHILCHHPRFVLKVLKGDGNIYAPLLTNPEREAHLLAIFLSQSGYVTLLRDRDQNDKIYAYHNGKAVQLPAHTTWEGF